MEVFWQWACRWAKRCPHVSPVSAPPRCALMHFFTASEAARCTLHAGHLKAAACQSVFTVSVSSKPKAILQQGWKIFEPPC